MKKKRVNVILDENIHKESVSLAKSFGYDFSAFVNLMLETLLYPVDIDGQESLLTEMFVKELTSRGFIVTRDALQLKRKKIQRQYVKKKG